MFSVPARCPAWRERPRSRAQRPLPSMTMATWRGNRSSASSGSPSVAGSARVVRGGPAVAREVRGTLDLHQLRFLVLAGFVHLGDVLVSQLLELIVGAAHLVLGDLVRLLQAAQFVVAVAADVAHGDAPLLHALVHHLCQVLATLLVELRQRQPDHAAVVGWGDAEIGFLDRLLDHA